MTSTRELEGFICLATYLRTVHETGSNWWETADQGAKQMGFELKVISLTC